MSNNNQPNGENNQAARNSRRETRSGLANATGGNTVAETPTVVTTGQGQAGTTGTGTGNAGNVVTNENRGLNVNPANTGNQNVPNINNPYANVRTASVFNEESLQKATAGKNKVASNPFADGDGGGEPNTNNTNGRVKLDKTQLDNHTRFLLRHYLDMANPVYEQEDVTITVKRRNGATEDVTRKKPVFKGYDFYAVNGESFDKWITENIGAGFKVDPMTKEIYKEGNAVNQTDTQIKNNNG